MFVRKRIFLSRLIGILFVLALLQAGPSQQVRPDDIAKKYPEIEGAYEFQLGQRTTVVQMFFKDGALRHVATGNTESTKWDPVEGSELTFKTVHPEQGTYLLEFLKDEQGRLSRFRIVNEAAKMDVIATRKRDLDDDEADPASPEDRLGYFERHYRKSEHRVPMRDGVHLFTQVYSPIDESEPHPIILFRTPYGIPPYGEAFTNMTLPSLYFLKENYILVFQDIRGRFMSEGTFQFNSPYKADKKSAADVDESSDACDTVAWLLKNVPHHNGKVGAWGISYPGFTAAMAALASHPAVLGSGNRPWNDAMAHETYDAFWKARSIYPYLRDIKPAILVVGGWYDAENIGGALGTYKTIEKHNPGLQNTLVMGPWAHGRWNLRASRSPRT
jgi:predicted acyl esterase